MKNSICTIVLLLVALFLTSCEKDELLVEDTFTPTQIAPAELPSNTQIDTSKSIEILVETSEISNRSTEELLLEETIELGRDDWYAPFIEKDRMEAGCSYRMSVTTTAGQTQAYLLGFRNGDFRNISATPDVEDSTVTLTGTSEDLRDTETRMYFAVHSAQGARFDIAIHKICEEAEAEVFNPENISINIQNASANSSWIYFLQDIFVEVEVGQPSLVDYVDLSYKLAGDEAYRFIRREHQAPYEWGNPQSNNDDILKNILEPAIIIQANIHLLDGTMHTIDKALEPDLIFLRMNIEQNEVYNKDNLKIEVTDAINFDRINLMFLDDNQEWTFIRSELNAPYTWNTNKDEFLRNLSEGSYKFRARGYLEDKLIATKSVSIYINDVNIDCSLATGLGNVAFCSTFTPQMENRIAYKLKQAISVQEGGGRYAFRIRGINRNEFFSIEIGRIVLSMRERGIEGFVYSEREDFLYKNSALKEGDLIEVYINPNPSIPGNERVRVFINGSERTMIDYDGVPTSLNSLPNVEEDYISVNNHFTELCIETGIPLSVFDNL